MPHKHSSTKVLPIDSVHTNEDLEETSILHLNNVVGDCSCPEFDGITKISHFEVTTMYLMWTRNKLVDWDELINSPAIPWFLPALHTTRHTT